MTAYHVQKALYDYLRAREHAPRDQRPEISAVVEEGDYLLDDDERKAVEELDLGKLYVIGVHPVLINSLARNMGYRKADYRPLLAGSMAPERKVKPRWLKS